MATERTKIGNESLAKLGAIAQASEAYSALTPVSVQPGVLADLVAEVHASRDRAWMPLTGLGMNDGDRAEPLEEGRGVAWVRKPWGMEWIWAQTDQYVGKILRVRVGSALSLQYHRVKTESLMILCGRVRVELGGGSGLGGDVFEMTPRGRYGGARNTLHVAPMVVHRIEAIEDSDLVEVSTPELDDIVRLEDRYGRVK